MARGPGVDGEERPLHARHVEDEARRREGEDLGEDGGRRLEGDGDDDGVGSSGGLERDRGEAGQPPERVVDRDGVARRVECAGEEPAHPAGPADDQDLS